MKRLMTTGICLAFLTFFACQKDNLTLNLGPDKGVETRSYGDSISYAYIDTLAELHNTIVLDVLDHMDNSNTIQPSDVFDAFEDGYYEFTWSSPPLASVLSARIDSLEHNVKEMFAYNSSKSYLNTYLSIVQNAPTLGALNSKIDSVTLLMEANTVDLNDKYALKAVAEGFKASAKLWAPTSVGGTGVGYDWAWDYYDNTSTALRWSWRGAVVADGLTLGGGMISGAFVAGVLATGPAGIGVAAIGLAGASALSSVWGGLGIHG